MIRKPRLTLVAALALAAVGAVGLTACGGAKTAGGGTPAQSTPAAAPAPDVTPTTNAVEQATPQAKIRDRRIGGSGRDGNLIFTVNGIEAVTSIPQSYSAAAVPVRGGKFILVRVTVQNDGIKGVSPFCGGTGTTLIDSRNRNFAMNSSIAVAIPGNPQCENLDPGFQAQYQLVFQLPKTARAAALALWDPDQGMDYDGSESWVRVTLR